MKDLNSSLKRFIGRGKGDPNVRISFGKDTSGDNKEVLLNGLFYKGLRVSARDLGKDIKGTLWLLDIKLLFESIVDQISFPFVTMDIIIHVKVQGLRCSFLSKGVHTGERILLEGNHLLKDFLRAGHIAQSPPGHSPALREPTKR